MDPLPPADQHSLRAAEGWLELGNAAEAKAELGRLGPESAQHPDVLHTCWQVHRKTKEWDRCFEYAQALTKSAPDDPRAWTALAQTFYFTSRVVEAYDLALSKIGSFPTHWPLYYDAACYACLTGRLAQARQFLQMASALGNEPEIAQMAHHDPDLKALWEKD